MQLVLSLFPGIDLLGLAFKREGFCVVQGGDVIFGGDIRDEHYPSGKFDGVIGGPPCQAFSPLAHMVRHNGYEPKFGNLIPEFERVVAETKPRWFLMENVPAAPIPAVKGYETFAFIFDNRQVGEKQSRKRRFTFGSNQRTVLFIEIVPLENIERQYAVVGAGGAATPTAATRKLRKSQRLNSAVGWNIKSERAFKQACLAQGLPDGIDLPGFTVTAKCKAIGNSVPLPMGRAIARAVKEATEKP